jgi:hypothetical protein
VGIEWERLLEHFFTCSRLAIVRAGTGHPGNGGFAAKAKSTAKTPRCWPHGRSRALRAVPFAGVICWQRGSECRECSGFNLSALFPVCTPEKSFDAPLFLWISC